MKKNFFLLHLEDGSLAIGLFNRGNTESNVAAAWKAIGISGKFIVRDLWRQKDLGVFKDKFTSPGSAHGVIMVRLTKKE